MFIRFGSKAWFSVNAVMSEGLWIFLNFQIVYLHVTSGIGLSAPLLQIHAWWKHHVLFDLYAGRFSRCGTSKRKAKNAYQICFTETFTHGYSTTHWIDNKEDPAWDLPLEANPHLHPSWKKTRGSLST